MRYLGTKDESADIATRGDLGGGGSSAIVGEMKMWPTATAPSGYLLCDGTEYNNSTYPALAALLGTTYGGTAGSTFKVPNFVGRFPRMGAVGNTGGSATADIDLQHVPPHTHAMDHDHTVTAGGEHGHEAYLSPTDGSNNNTARKGAFGDRGSFQPPVHASQSTHSHQIPRYSGLTGNGSDQGLGQTPLDVLNPYLNVSFIIKHD
jgi:microcystin-dependent protein